MGGHSEIPFSGSEYVRINGALSIALSLAHTKRGKEASHAHKNKIKARIVDIGNVRLFLENRSPSGRRERSFQSDYVTSLNLPLMHVDSRLLDITH